MVGDPLVTSVVEQAVQVTKGLRCAFVVIPKVETTDHPGPHSTISAFKVMSRSNIQISDVSIWSEDLKITSSHFC